jgi:hypothetical protein
VNEPRATSTTEGTSAPWARAAARYSSPNPGTVSLTGPHRFSSARYLPAPNTPSRSWVCFPGASLSLPTSLLGFEVWALSPA